VYNIVNIELTHLQNSNGGVGVKVPLQFVSCAKHYQNYGYFPNFAHNHLHDPQA